MNNIQIKEKLRQAFPPVPAAYDNRINTVLQSLETKPLRLRRTSRKRFRFTPGKIAAAALALIIIGSCCAFAARPALAADIPVVNEIVYTLSPAVEPDEDIQNEIAETVQEVLSGFISNATRNIGLRFKPGSNWALNENTLLAAYYLHFKAASAELINNGKTPALANIAVKTIEAEQRGFRYTATLVYDVLLDDEYYTTEIVTARLEESASGLYITSLDISSEGFKAYKKNIEQYDRSEYYNGTLDENIANYNAFLIGRQIALDEKEKYQTTDAGTGMTQYEQERVEKFKQSIKTVKEANYKTESERKNRLKQLEDELAQFIALRTPRNRRLEDLAAELCYRYWSAKEMPDMSDIMERNDDTELWFLAVKLNLENKFRPPAATAQKGYAEILEITGEADELVTAKVYVKTIIDGGVGQEAQITFKSTGGQYIIVAFSSPLGDGLHRRLEMLADQYMKEGMSHSDANKKAYETTRTVLLETIKELEDMMENQ